MSSFQIIHRKKQQLNATIYQAKPFFPLGGKFSIYMERLLRTRMEISPSQLLNHKQAINLEYNFEEIISREE